jgi:hypothetical protein
MSDNNHESEKAPYVAYAVEDRGEQKKPFWTRIGVGFTHGDGKGMTLRVGAWPAGGNRLVLRERDADQQAEDAPPAE